MVDFGVQSFCEALWFLFGKEFLIFSENGSECSTFACSSLLLLVPFFLPSFLPPFLPSHM